jgi:hypothetical protein
MMPPESGKRTEAASSAPEARGAVFQPVIGVGGDPPGIRAVGIFLFGLVKERVGGDNRPIRFD